MAREVDSAPRDPSPTGPVPPAAGFAPILKLVARAVRPYLADSAILLALLSLTLWVRWATLQRIENGGDPLDNWFFVKQWAHNDNPFGGYLNHHNARVGIHGLTWIAQSLFGTGVAAYYVAPLFASHVCSALTYTLGRLCVSRSVGVIATLLLLEFNPLAFASSQLRPGIFEAMYVLGAANFVAAYVLRGDRTRTWALVGAGVCSFLGYLAKVPTLFAVPGLALALLLSGGGIRSVLVYAGVLTAGIGLETLSYQLFTEYPHRVAIILNAHASGQPRARTFWWLLSRFARAGDSWRLVFYFFFASGLTIVTSKRPLAAKVPVILAGSMLFLATFGVRRIHPIAVWMGMLDRYLTLAIPPAVVACATVLVESTQCSTRALCGAIRRRAPSLLGHLRGCRPYLAPATLLSLGLLVGAKTWTLSRKHRANHPLTEMQRTASLLSDAYARNLPIVAKVSRRPTARRKWSQVRDLHWAYKGFVDTALLLDGEGNLPSFSHRKSVGTVDGARRYLPNVPGLSGKTVRQMLKKDKGCTVVLNPKGIFTLTSEKKRWTLPARCKSGRHPRQEK